MSIDILELLGDCCCECECEGQIPGALPRPGGAGTRGGGGQSLPPSSMGAISPLARVPTFPTPAPTPVPLGPAPARPRPVDSPGAGAAPGTRLEMPPLRARHVLDEPFIPPPPILRDLPPGPPGWASFRMDTTLPGSGRNEYPLLVLYNVGSTGEGALPILGYSQAELEATFGEGKRPGPPAGMSLTEAGQVLLLLPYVQEWVDGNWLTDNEDAWAVLPRPGQGGTGTWGKFGPDENSYVGVVWTAPGAVCAVSLSGPDTDPNQPNVISEAKYFHVTGGGGTLTTLSFPSITRPPRQDTGAHGFELAAYTYNEAGRVYLKLRHNPGTGAAAENLGWYSVDGGGVAAQAPSGDCVTWLASDGTWAYPGEKPAANPAAPRFRAPSLYGWLEAVSGVAVDLPPLDVTRTVPIIGIKRVKNGHLLYGDFGRITYHTRYDLPNDVVLRGAMPDALLVSSLTPELQDTLLSDGLTLRVPGTAFYGAQGLNAPQVLPPRPLTVTELAPSITTQNATLTRPPLSEPLRSPSLRRTGGRLEIPGETVEATVVFTPPEPLPANQSHQVWVSVLLREEKALNVMGGSAFEVDPLYFPAQAKRRYRQSAFPGDRLRIFPVAPDPEKTWRLDLAQARLLVYSVDP